MDSLDYIPPKDSEFNDFQDDLFDAIDDHQPGTANPWGYPQQRVNTMSTKKNRWDAAWAIAKNEHNRTEGDVEEKDEARLEYEADIRDFVNQWLAFNDLITDEERIEMGLHVRDTTPSTINVVNYAPSGSVDNIKPLFQTIRIQNPTTPDTQAMPKAHRVEVQTFIGAANTLETAMVFTTYRISGRFLVRISFTAADRGKTVYYRLRYINRKGDAGPFSAIFNSVIA